VLRFACGHNRLELRPDGRERSRTVAHVPNFSTELHNLNRENNERTMDRHQWLELLAMHVPLREPLVTPTPEQLFGFPTLEEAEEAQRICMTAQWHTRAAEKTVFRSAYKHPTVAQIR